ncbi:MULTISPECIES: hypothetical protein [Streptomyces]|uniref:Uncharacterized protein n=1 Tax=Streptomyces pini TaxID=1520580 RepID=A0A1I4DZZ9_9ACTN|nr:hypothetical protein [Streptomyces pini]SFK98573.1 hypothetical protein SAMN05192584_11173 [Streptomyces pini]
MRDEDIVAAARDIRAESSAPGANEPGFDTAALDALLRRASSGERVGDEILALLTSSAAVRRELSRRLPQEEDTDRSAADGPGYSGLPGFGEPSAEIVHRCPVCGYEYPLFEVGEPVPEECPDGHGPLALTA